MLQVCALLLALFAATAVSQWDMKEAKDTHARFQQKKSRDRVEDLMNGSLHPRIRKLSRWLNVNETLQRSPCDLAIPPGRQKWVLAEGRDRGSDGLNSTAIKALLTCFQLWHDNKLAKARQQYEQTHCKGIRDPNTKTINVMLYIPRQGLADVLDQLPRRILYAIWSGSLLFFDDKTSWVRQDHQWHVALQSPWASFMRWSTVQPFFCNASTREGGYTVQDVSEYKMDQPADLDYDFSDAWKPMFAQFVYQPSAAVAKIISSTFDSVPSGYLLLGLHYR
jgi:hypothetical protein